MEIFDNEIWKDIPNYEGIYQASNLGRVKSLKRPYGLKEKFLKPKLTRNGYYLIKLYKNSKERFYYVHRLVWTAFNGSIPEGLQVNHINEIKSDNRLENLNLMTAKENCNWGSRNERRAKKQINGKKSKPVLQFTLEDVFVKEYPSLKQVKRETGFNQGNIVNCCNGKYKQMYGYIWKYAKEMN